MTTTVGNVVHIYPREVFFSQLKMGVPSRSVHLTVVDTTGDPITPTNAVSVTPEDFITDERGFGPQIAVSSTIQGVFQIRAEFLDKHAKGTSYSMPIRFSASR
jgi:hypothetical protein